MSAAPPGPLVFAHRGSSAELPEHTLAAYLRALQEGADGLECDVRLTRDGHLVCVHDRRLDRTSNGRGRVSRHTLAELTALDFGSWHRSTTSTLTDRPAVPQPGPHPTGAQPAAPHRAGPDPEGAGRGADRTIPDPVRGDRTTAEPAAGDAAAADLTGRHPIPWDLGGTDLADTDPGSTNRGGAGLGGIDPGGIDPDRIDPDRIDPGHIHPGRTGPGAVGPDAADLEAAELTAADLGRLGVGPGGAGFAAGTGPPDPDRTRLLTLGRLLDAVRDAGREVRLLIETKHPSRYGPAIERRLVTLLHRYGLAEPVPGDPVTVTVMSFSPLAVRRIRLLAPALPTVLLLEVLPPGIRLNRLPFGAHIAGPGMGLIRTRPGLLPALRAAGHPAYAWTVNTRRDLDLVLAGGVAGVISDRPRMVLDHLGR